MPNRETDPSARPRCRATHDPGVWPYMARCIKDEHKEGDHVDRYGGIWAAEPPSSDK